jgi:hypothetical protein
MSTRKIDTSHVSKLDSENYQQWKLQVTLLLKAYGVWGHVDGTIVRPHTDATLIQDWETKDVQAQAIIVPLLDKKQMSHIYTCSTSKGVWDKLKQINSDASNLNRQHTLSKFFNYKIGPNQSVVDAYVEIEDLARSLNEMGTPMDPAAVVTKIVSALPDSQFNAFKKAWDSVPELEQTLDRLLSRLRKEELELRQVETESEESSRAIAFAAQHKGKGQNNRQENPNQQKRQFEIKPKRRGNCNNCGIPGHWARECRKPKQDKQGQGKGQGQGHHNNQNNNQRQKPHQQEDESPECRAMMVRHSLNHTHDSPSPI